MKTKILTIGLISLVTSLYAVTGFVVKKRSAVVDLDLYEYIRVVRSYVDGFADQPMNEQERRLIFTKEYLKSKIDFITIEDVENNQDEVMRLLDVVQQLTAEVEVEEWEE
jgi:hypothetical protein